MATQPSCPHFTEGQVDIFLRGQFKKDPDTLWAYGVDHYQEVVGQDLHLIVATINDFFEKAYPAAIEGKLSFSYEFLLNEKMKQKSWIWKEAKSVHEFFVKYPYAFKNFVEKMAGVAERCFKFQVTTQIDQEQKRVFWNLAWRSDHLLFNPKPAYFTGLNPQFNKEEIKKIVLKLDPQVDIPRLSESIAVLLKTALLESRRGHTFTQLPIQRPPEAEKNVMQQVFTSFQISDTYTTQGADTTLTLSWKGDNPHLGPQFVTLEPPVAEAQAAHNRWLLTSGEFSDVTVKVGEKLFNCHRALLVACGFFKAEFRSKYKDANAPVIEFNRCDAETFSEVLEFIYTGKFPSRDKCVEMFQLAHYLEHEALKELVKWQIFTFASNDNYLQIALMLTQLGIEDPDLEKLSGWFLKTFSFEQLDLSKLTCLNVLRVYQMGLKYTCEPVTRAAAEQFGICFDPQKDLISLFECITQERSSALRDFLKSHLEKDPFFKLMQRGEVYALYLAAYTALMSDLRFT
jgi:hypothetical protein